MAWLMSIPLPAVTVAHLCLVVVLIAAIVAVLFAHDDTTRRSDVYAAAPSRTMPVVRAQPARKFARPQPSGPAGRRGVVCGFGEKTVLFGDEARQKLSSGIDQVANAVKVTLGPKGRNVVLEREYGSPEIVNDGVTIARAVKLADAEANCGVRLIQDVASKSDASAGDGTTTSTLMAQVLVQRGMRAVMAGNNPVALRKGMLAGAAALTKKIKELAVPVSSNEDLLNIATVSTSGDIKMGTLIAKAFEKVGDTGSTVVEESQTLSDQLEFTEGYTIDRGFISSYFVNKEDTATCDMTNPKLLVTDKKIEKVQDLVPILEQVIKAKVPLMIVAEDITGEALSALVMNKTRGVLDIVAIKAPSFAERRREQLNDLCIATGATFIADQVGVGLDQVTMDMLGTCERVVVAKTNTKLITDGKQQENVAKRIEQIRDQRDTADLEFDREKCSERMAALGGGIARLKVGAATETELKDKKLRYEDALNAVKSAMEMGIVPGGGAAMAYLLRYESEIRETVVADPGQEEDFGAGLSVLFKSLTAPMMQIAHNAGVDGELVVERCKEVDQWGYGYNAATDTYEDLLEAGVVDPAKVTCAAIENATSVASLVLTTECLVTDIPVKMTAEMESAAFDAKGGVGRPEDYQYQ